MTAAMSPCTRYRYRLDRMLLPGRSICVFIMLNPSTADGMKDDPTIRRCTGFARRWGFSILSVFNLFAWRTADPDELAAVADPAGPDNEETIHHALLMMKMQEKDAPFRVVCAWGNRGAVGGRDMRMAELLDSLDIPAWCLGTTDTGQPRHPLYVPRDTELSRYAARRDPP